jgi:hypothetical protein
MQDEDGGFYFLVYPRERKYEQDVLPDHGDPQIVWPKNTAATAAAVAALAQCSSSPAFRKTYPDDARRYLASARRGWEFLQRAFEKYGRTGAYRKLTHYGDDYKDADEIAWAACELYLATGEKAFDDELHARLNPTDPNTRRWGWKRMSESFGNAMRSYTFGARSGRVEKLKLEPKLLRLCENEIIACAEDWCLAAKKSAYGTSYPEPTKHVVGAGWYFSMDQAFDLAVAAQLDYPAMKDRRPDFRAAIDTNLGYEAGCNPVNVCYITGLGWNRPHEIVHQYAQNDRRALPPDGIPLGSIQDGFGWMDNYKQELGALCYPLDGSKEMPTPIYDRWGDSFNLETEFVITNQARALGVAAWLMAQSPAHAQTFKPGSLEILLPASASPNGPVTARVKLADEPARTARIVWEAKDQQPIIGREFTFTPREAGPQWIEVEATWPDGRRAVGVANFQAR